jgi:hypothetical protein
MTRSGRPARTGHPWNFLREPEQMSGFGIDVVRLNFAAPQSSDAVYLLA